MKQRTKSCDCESTKSLSSQIIAISVNVALCISQSTYLYNTVVRTFCLELADN